MNVGTTGARFALLCIAALLVALGCNLLESEGPDLDPITSGLYFILHDQRSGAEKDTVSLDVWTSTVIGCAYEIVGVATVHGGDITARFVGIQGPREDVYCFRSGPAYYHTDLGLARGDYRLLLVYHGIEDRYAVSVADTIGVSPIGQPRFTRYMTGYTEEPWELARPAASTERGPGSGEKSATYRTVPAEEAVRSGFADLTGEGSLPRVRTEPRDGLRQTLFERDFG